MQSPSTMNHMHLFTPHKLSNSNRRLKLRRGLRWIGSQSKAYSLEMVMAVAASVVMGCPPAALEIRQIRLAERSVLFLTSFAIFCQAS